MTSFSQRLVPLQTSLRSAFGPSRSTDDDQKPESIHLRDTLPVRETKGEFGFKKSWLICLAGIAAIAAVFGSGNSFLRYYELEDGRIVLADLADHARHLHALEGGGGANLETFAEAETIDVQRAHRAAAARGKERTPRLAHGQEPKAATHSEREDRRRRTPSRGQLASSDRTSGTSGDFTFEFSTH